MPLKTKRVRKSQHPWLYESIFESMKKRDEAKCKAIKTQNENAWKDYRVLKNKVTSLIKKGKRAYYEEHFAKDQNSNNSWKTLSSLVPKKTSSSLPPSSQCQSMANQFNHHFANVATGLISTTSESETETSTSDSSSNGTRVKYPLNFSTVDEDFILREIQQLKNKKSVGLDGISVKILKMSKEVIIRPICYLINKSITSGIVPKKWKVAKIVPLHKKGDKANPNNYRPISILPCLSKILERVVQKQLVEHLNKNNLLTIEQSGFRPKHSTATALIKVTDEWLKSIDDGKFTGAVFVDLQKAFDLVNIQCLLNKLLQIGITGTPLKWFENYLSNRKIATCIGSCISEELSIGLGVPQGSILGPLLFIIFINDLPSVFDSCKVHLYADDTVIYFSNKNPQMVQSTLNKELILLNKWMNKNKLKVNYDKTVCMLIGNRHMLQNFDRLDLCLNGYKISQVKTFKYLGLFIDAELKWDVHINNLCEKVGRMISFLRRLRLFVNRRILNQLYRSIILPHLDYADIIWQSSYEKYTSQLQKLQNRAGRIILKLKPELHFSVNSIHEILHWETLKSRQKSHVEIMMYKILNDLTPNYLRQNVLYSQRPYQLRNNNLYLPKPRTNNCKRAFFYRGIKLYNALPQPIRDCASLSMFKRLLAH